MLAVQSGALEFGNSECMYKLGMTKHICNAAVERYRQVEPSMCLSASSAETVQGSVSWGRDRVGVQ